MNSNIEKKLNVLPDVSGIYKFLDKDGKILYIGKAINLRKRVSSYFHTDLYDRPRIKQMMPLVFDLEIIETNNEIEALILESALVKRYQPLFNTALKDDKSYAWIYIDTKNEFPTVKIVRSLHKGEFSKGRLFGPFPSGFTIKRVYSYLRKLYPFCTCKNKDCKSSLYYHIGLCPGPYAGAISKEEYRDNINNIIKFLSGKQQNHIKRLEKEMIIYSKMEEFEKASQLRDRIKDLKYIGQDIDFTYYDDIESYESKREKVRKSSFNYLAMELGLDNLHRIECYDISNIQGKYAYGSMVVAIDGLINRSEYRIFKIKESNTPNDYLMLKEVLSRRLKQKENIPEVILIDGGKGQLSSVGTLIPKNVVLMGISKGKYLKKKGKKINDEFWIYRDGNVFRINIIEPELLIDLRNEAHRFAITYFRKKSIKEAKVSILDKVEGVGVKRRKELIMKFGSVDNIKKASIEDINSVVKNIKVSKKIKDTMSNL